MLFCYAAWLRPDERHRTASFFVIHAGDPSCSSQVGAISSLRKAMTVKESPIMRTAIAVLIVPLVFNFAAVARCDNDTPQAAEKAGAGKKAAEKADAGKKAAENKKSADKPDRPDKPETLPRLKDPDVRTMDEVKAFFQRGIATTSQVASRSHTSGKFAGGGKRKQNRIYTVRELLAKFGDPNQRERHNGGGVEAWTYDCQDGQCFVHFTSKGYGGTSGTQAEGTQRLQLDSVSITSGATGAGARDK